MAALMRRCVTCNGVIWPWHRVGWYVWPGRVDYWHARRCQPDWEWLSITGYANPDGSGEGNWYETDDYRFPVMRDPEESPNDEDGDEDDWHHHVAPVPGNWR